MKQKSSFNKSEYDKLYSSGSAPIHLYDTPIMHKSFYSDSIPKLRPNVSSIGTFNYNLARFLWDLPSPLVADNYPCEDTFSLVSQIKNANLSTKVLHSYDVTSLFNNTPLQETIDIAINLVSNDNPNLKITKKELNSVWYITDSFIMKVME